MYLLAVDGGRTKTIAIILDNHGNVLGKGLGGPVGLYSTTCTKVLNNIRTSLDLCLRSAGLSANELSVAVFGLCDLDTSSMVKEAWRIIKELKLPCRVLIKPDFVTAYYAVTYGSPGACVIAGTGSIAYGVNENGREARAGGWGWIIGDEGSAYWIAQKALSAAAKYFDGIGEETILLDEIAKFYNINSTNFIDIIDVIHIRLRGDPTEIAKIARVVDEGARMGDDISRKILEDAGERLARLAHGVVKRLEIKQPVIGGVGSVFNSEIVKESFHRNIMEKVENAIIKPPMVGYKPVIGAAILALKTMGVLVEDKLVKRLMNSI